MRYVLVYDMRELCINAGFQTKRPRFRASMLALFQNGAELPTLPVQELPGMMA